MKRIILTLYPLMILISNQVQTSEFDPRTNRLALVTPHLEFVREKLGFPLPKREGPPGSRLKVSLDDIALPTDTFIHTRPDTLQLFADILQDRPLHQKAKGMSEQEKATCCLANGWSPVRFAIVQRNIPATESLLRTGFRATEDDFHVAELLLRDPHKPRLTSQHQRFLASLYDHVQEKSEEFIESHMQNINNMKRGRDDGKSAITWSDEALFIKAAQKKDLATMNTLVKVNNVNPNQPYCSLDVIEISAIHCAPEVTREAIKLGAVVTQRHLEHAMLRKEALKASIADKSEPYAGDPNDLRNLNRVIEILATHATTPQISSEAASVLGFLRSYGSSQSPPGATPSSTRKRNQQ